MIKMDSEMTLLCLIVICGLYSPVTSTNPGLTLQLSQSGLNYAATVAIDSLVKDVQGQPIPDQHGHGHHADYDLTGMKVTSFTRPASTVIVNQGKGITWSLSGAAVSVHGDWRYKLKKGFIHISDHGSFDVKVKRVSLTVTISMGVAKDGRPTISMASCNSDVGDVDIKIHGGASWLYNLFRHALESPVEKALKKILCKSVQKGIDEDAAKSLAKMKVQVPIEGILLLDYRLVSPPVFGAGFVETHHKGEFMWTQDPKEAPFQPGPLSISAGAHKMVTFGLSDYVTNTLGYVAHQHGFLNYTLTKNDLQKKDASLLNTSCTIGTCIGSFLPMIAKKYPDGSLELVMATTVAPKLCTTKNMTKGIFSGKIDFTVRLPDKSLNQAFTAYIDANFTISANMTGDNITADVKAFSFNVTKVDSAIGTIPEKLLQFYFKLAAESFIVPKLKEIGRKGFVLPGIDHVQFVNPQLNLMEGAIRFTTDAKYNPTLWFTPHAGTVAVHG